jgi:hypothetical protein
MGLVESGAEPLFVTFPDCPSELRLDRLYLKALAENETSQTRAHLESCERCRARWTLRDKGFAAFGDVDAEELLAKIDKRAAIPGMRIPPAISQPMIVLSESKKRVEPQAPPPRKLWPAAASAMLVIALAGVIYFSPAPEETRLKGGTELTIFRERGGEVVRAGTADSFRAGDRLRFAVDVEHQEIMIVSVKQGGKLSTFFPADGSKRSKPAQQDDRGALPGAIELDDSATEEYLHLVACPAAFSIDDLKPGARPDLLDTPSGCRRTTLLLKKERSP